MSQPLMMIFSQHLSDDEKASYHKMHQTMERSNPEWIFKEENLNGKMVLLEITSHQYLLQKIMLLKRRRKARSLFCMAIPKEHLRDFMEWMMLERFGKAIRTRFGGLEKDMTGAPNKLTITIGSPSVLKYQLSTYTHLLIQKIFKKETLLAGFVDEVIYSLFAQQSEDLDLLHEDLEPIDDVDIEDVDIIWQIAMIAIRNEEVFTEDWKGRVRIDGNKPVGFDKKKLECFKCHNTGHFARECPSKGTNDGKKRDSFYQDQGAGKKEQNQNCLLTMDDGVVNWGEHTVEEEETNHALMAISSNTEVSLCSKTCIDSYNKLKTLCDEQMNQLGEQEAKILAYTLAVKKLEAQIVTFQKQQLSLNEQLTFQANEIYAKDEKLKRYRIIGMKVVKEKEQLQETVDSWKNSSKNLWKLVDSGMTSNSKVGLGYEIQSNKEVLSYEEEMNRTVFQCTEKDFLNKPLYSRFSKTENFKGVHQKPKISDSDDNSTKHSTCQSNDSEGSFGNPSKHSSESESESISVPNEMSASNLSHLIKDCDYYEKKMAREAELKKQRVFNTGNGVAKPVWNNAHRVNHANHFVPRPVQLNAVRQNVNSVRPNVNTGRVNVNSVRPNVNTGRVNVNSVRHNVNSVRTNVNTGRSKQPVPTCNSNSFSPGNWGTAVKTSAGESLYDAWTRFNNLIQRVPHHGLNLWSLAQFFYDHVNRYIQIDIDYVAGGNLRRLSAEEVWETIEDCAQCDKQ
ncbi:ribonuclease H-like domain-containing protein [Tanacetum coccineum]